LLKRSVEAQQALAEAAALDQAVRPGDAGEAPKGLLDKIVKAVD